MNVRKCNVLRSLTNLECLQQTYPNEWHAFTWSCFMIGCLTDINGPIRKQNVVSPFWKPDVRSGPFSQQSSYLFEVFELPMKITLAYSDKVYSPPLYHSINVGDKCSVNVYCKRKTKRRRNFHSRFSKDERRAYPLPPSFPVLFSYEF